MSSAATAVEPSIDSSSSSTDEMTKGKLTLKKWLNRYMKVKITDGRVLIGVFLCTDKDQNIILGLCQEYMNSPEPGAEARVLGLAMIPGHHIISIDIDEAI